MAESQPSATSSSPSPASCTPLSSPRIPANPLEIRTNQSKTISPPRVCALFVAYDPKREVLESAIRSLASGTERTLIYDNSEGHERAPLEWPGLLVEVLGDGRNVGVATAQNILLRRAMAEGFEIAILSDQDTIYPEGFVNDMLAHNVLSPDVAAVCPGWLDLNATGTPRYPGQYVFDARGRLRIDRSESHELVIAHAIASGMLVNLHVLPEIGLMADDLFIDWVDNEWCWRARRQGFRILACPRVRLKHRLGDATVPTFGRAFVKRSPIRNYYIIRNALYLLLYSDVVTPGVRRYLAAKLLHHAVFSLAASRGRRHDIAALFQALVDAFRGRLGRRDERR